ncbi:MAG: flagellar export protein FliJ [Planctomycetota bacterium]|nr:flagellar export protein FliJ [Planctomycetota bacterium]
MARFRFKLEPLLKARRHAEREKQRAVAELERQRLDLEDALRRRQAFIVEGKAALRDRLVGDLDMPSLRAHAGSTVQVMREAERLVLELAGVHKRLEAARGELVEAARERRSLELLRDRRLAQWKAALNKAEDAALDELAVHAAARRER